MASTVFGLLTQVLENAAAALTGATTSQTDAQDAQEISAAISELQALVQRWSTRAASATSNVASRPYHPDPEVFKQSVAINQDIRQAGGLAEYGKQFVLPFDFKDKLNTAIAQQQLTDVITTPDVVDKVDKVEDIFKGIEDPTVTIPDFLADTFKDASLDDLKDITFPTGDGKTVQLVEVVSGGGPSGMGINLTAEDAKAWVDALVAAGAVSADFELSGATVSTSSIIKALFGKEGKSMAKRVQTGSQLFDLYQSGAIDAARKIWPFLPEDVGAFPTFAKAMVSSIRPNPPFGVQVDIPTFLHELNLVKSATAIKDYIDDKDKKIYGWLTESYGAKFADWVRSMLRTNSIVDVDTIRIRIPNPTPPVRVIPTVDVKITTPELPKIPNFPKIEIIEDTFPAADQAQLTCRGRILKWVRSGAQGTAPPVDKQCKLLWAEYLAGLQTAPQSGRVEPSSELNNLEERSV